MGMYQNWISAKINYSHIINPKCPNKFHNSSKIRFYEFTASLLVYDLHLVKIYLSKFHFNRNVKPQMYIIFFTIELWRCILSLGIFPKAAVLKFNI